MSFPDTSNRTQHKNLSESRLQDTSQANIFEASYPACCIPRSRKISLNHDSSTYRVKSNVRFPTVSSEGFCSVALSSDHPPAPEKAPTTATRYCSCVRQGKFRFRQFTNGAMRRTSFGEISSERPGREPSREVQEMPEKIP